MVLDYQELGVIVEIEGDVMTVTIDRPTTKNSQTPELWTAFADICSSIPQFVRFAVVRSTGNVFSSGLDRSVIDGSGSGLSLVDLAAKDELALRDFIRSAQAGFSCWRSIPQTTIALVQGPAIGAGWQLALSCDLILALPESTFALKETRLGLIPDLGGTGRLISAVGYHRAFDICSTGREVTAIEAAQCGLARLAETSLDHSLQLTLNELRGVPAQAVAELKLLLDAVAEGAPSWEAEQSAQIRRLTDVLGQLRGTEL